jgi:hypothetical protein
VADRRPRGLVDTSVVIDMERIDPAELSELLEVVSTGWSDS